MLLPLPIVQVFWDCAMSLPPVLSRKPVFASADGSAFQSPASIHGLPHANKYVDTEKYYKNGQSNKN